jgi:hypothetical protein
LVQKGPFLVSKTSKRVSQSTNLRGARQGSSDPRLFFWK